MRAIFWKEFRELSVAGLPMAVVAVPLALGIGMFRIGDEVLVALLAGGGILGIVQGVFDKLGTRGTFLFHRDVSRWRIAAARTTAGAAHVVAATAVLLVTLRLHAATYDAELMRQFFQGREIEPTVLTFGQNLLCVATALAVWATVRLGFSFRRVPHIFAYFVGWCMLLLPILAREHVATALVVAAAVAAACCAAVLARPRLRNLILCGLVAWMALGLCGMGRAATSAALLAAYPRLGIAEDGDVVYLQSAEHGLKPDPLRHSRDVAGDALPAFRISWRNLEPLDNTTVFDCFDRREPRPGSSQAPYDYLRAFIEDLNREERRANPTAPRQWRKENGKLVASDGTVHELGDDLRPVAGSHRLRQQGSRVQQFASVFSAARRKLILLDAVTSRKAERPVVSVREFAIPEWTPQSILGGHDREILWVTLELGDGRLQILDMFAGKVLLDTVLPDGVPMVRRAEPLQAVFASRASAIDPVVQHVFLRVAQASGVRDHEIELRPVGVWENTVAGAGGCIAVLRPLPLNALAYFSSPAGSERAFFDPWRDTWFRGGKRAGWLLVGLLVSCACAWRAWSQARMRLSGGRGVWVAIAFLFGPLGLLWMRIRVPKFHVEEVAGQRRAVNLGAPWPEPAATGLEVMSCSSS